MACKDIAKIDLFLIVDVEIGGDSVQTATISWKGTYSASSSSN